ncbi:MAG: gluconate 2-dehydrogenase subunit 3 family protein [Proteobacteria bacterium]|uniref:gluconate 2-dehydrogenase subunit 3 family protein n=1 Tax=Rudaea sp. TaxID=2136325 RepID=UPI00321F65F9|nr:gluconate 2-dehydrogenase subunit 3 family protein [Pseudomonadota bacterium]
MNRREVLQRVAALVGGTISAPAVFAVLDGHAQTPTPDWKPSALGKDELAVVEQVVDIMLPRTDTPGALDVGVPAFIDGMLKEVYSQQARDHFRQGLQYFDAAARKEYRKPFVGLERSRQRALVQRFHDVGIAVERTEGERKQKALVQQVRAAAMLPQRTQSAPVTHPRSFILTVKELALLGFFTSRPGATQVLQYAAIPGTYHGCLPVNQAGNGKRWAT